uniref:Putative transketolase domain containing protein n=1 Tax=viral metagenome TaxID=1070528 RepID=A0A6M3IUG2_9ZZZZ
MEIKNKDLKRRLIELSYKYKLSHLGSVLTAVDIIEEIYWAKKPKEKFILSCGHAGLALYCVIEKYLGVNAEKIWLHHGTHPDRCLDCHLDCSTGSLGQGLPISCGLALADRKKNVYCLISDGECSEGSIWEAMRIKDEQKLNNLIVYLNYNRFGAYKETPFPVMLIGDTCPISECEHRQKGNLYYPPNIDRIVVNLVNDFPFLKGLDAHYKIMSEEEYLQAMEILK